MQITIEKPINGWLPFSISIGGRCIEFRASNVVNDPLTDLLFAAVWSIAPDYSFPAMSAGINPPHTAPRLRAAHFWLEPDWHTLVVEEIGGNNVDLWFAVGHKGGLFIDGNDISTTHLTLCGREPAFTFAKSVYLSLQRLLTIATPPELAQHWNRPFPFAVFHDLERWFQQIGDAATAG